MVEEWFRMWTNFENSIETIDLLSPGARAQTERAMKANYSPSGGYPHAWYQTHKAHLNPEAVRFIDSLVAQSTSGA